MKYLVVLFLVFFTILASAQAPQRMSYQAVIRNSNNTLVSQQLIGVRISILQADTAGQAVYIETHYTKTNLNGLMTLQIGGGLKFFGDFSSIDWSSGHYFIKTETDPDGGFDYRITGYSELLSVPYALYAGNKTANNSVTKADLDSTHYFDINLQGNISASKNVTVKGNIEALGSTSTLGTIDKPFKGLFLSAGSLSIASDTLGQNIPAAVLSNVEGNLQISAGGLKLLNDASFIARNIQGELEGNASTATALKTPRKINGVSFDGTADILIDNTNNNYVKNESLNGTVPFNMSIDGNFNSSKNVTVAGNIEALGSTSTLGTITKPFKGLFISSGSLSIASDTLGQDVPAAVLSNVTGNLQISAGGVKLMGDNTSFIAPRIVGALTGNASTATKLENARTINNIPFDGTTNITIATTSPNSLTYSSSGTGEVPGGAYDGSIAKTISYNSIGASPSAGSSLITTVGTLTAGSIPFTLLTGTIPTWNQSTTGNAATATKLAATKTINGIAFDGSADILISAVADAGTLSGTTLKSTILNSSLTSVGTLANLTVTNPISGSVTGNAATATYATTAGTLSGTVPYTSLSGTTPTWNQSTTGNAATATKLAATKNINGIAFDGSADISITAIADAGTLSGTTLNSTILNSSLTSVGTLANLTVTNPISGSVTGNAATATYATTAGTLSGTVPYTSLSGTTPTWNQSTTGNAATATKLAATKNINGIAFDGSADISITAIADAGTLSGTTLNSTILNSSLTSVGTLANLTVTNPISGSVTGNAATATYATTAGTLSGTVPYTSLSGTTPTWNQSTTGNAATATYATTAGSLTGTVLNSSITSSSLTSVGTLANLTVSNPISGSITGNAATATYATTAGTASTATKLAATKTINGIAFDGSADIFITAVADAGTLSGTTLNSTITNSSLTSVGIITTGTWSASTIDIAHGGTNSSATPTAGGIVYGNGTAHSISSAGTSGQYLQSAGSGTPIWAQPGPTSIQVLTTSGTYSPSSGVKAIIVELVGAGGGSGGVVAVSNSNQGTVSGGGGSGAYTRAIIINPNTSYTFVIGIGGTASGTGVAGGNGGATSFNASPTINAPGGTGGSAGSSSATGTVSLGGAGGVEGTGGSFMVPGHSGGSGFSTGDVSVAGAGANSYFGDGGTSPAVVNSSSAGIAGIGYGAGASGAASKTTGSGAVGAAGFHGVIIVTEYK